MTNNVQILEEDYSTVIMPCMVGDPAKMVLHECVQVFLFGCCRYESHRNHEVRKKAGVITYISLHRSDQVCLLLTDRGTECMHVPFKGGWITPYSCINSSKTMD